MRIQSSLILLACFLPAFVFAATPITDDEAKLKVFSDACVAKWVEDGGANKTNPIFKAFGTDFCTCAGKQMLPILNKENATMDEMEIAKRKASETCLTEAVLRQSVSSFKSKDEINPTKLETACSTTWQLLFPNGMNDTQKQFVTYFCHCSAKPLAEASQNKQLNADQFTAKISDVAATCRK